MTAESGSRHPVTRYGISRDELGELLADQPRYRLEQVWQGLYDQYVDPEAMTNLPLALRERLAAELPHALTETTRSVSDDGDTVKWLWALEGGASVETVLMHYDERSTVCISSQAGCAMACGFCATGQAGFERHLSRGEIVEQVVRAIREAAPRRVSNIVFMGMGEPMDNFDNVTQAVRVLTDRCGMSFSMSRVAISTVGRIQGIKRLAKLGWRRLNLAVSLNAPNDHIRAQIMPITRTDSMGALREALLDYPLRKCQFFMIEYVLIPGLNDAREHAQELAEFLRPVKCVVNVIPYNPRRESPWAAPSEASVVNFMLALIDAGQMCKRRLTKGRDQMAACGQLGRKIREDERG
jgi:23S rRNA (adenine2503-C2)-methyltransferase